jgi:hypothetical protein
MSDCSCHALNHTCECVGIEDKVRTEEGSKEEQGKKLGDRDGLQNLRDGLQSEYYVTTYYAVLYTTTCPLERITHAYATVTGRKRDGCIGDN